MKTILVDAWNTFVTENWIFNEMKELLDTYPNKKIIVTNANDEQIIAMWMTNLPYELFTLKHNPEKTDPEYFKILIRDFNLNTEDLIYFEHNILAVESAKLVWINVHHYDKDKKDLEDLKIFIDNNLK